VTANVERFDLWIRNDFVNMNTQLEQLYRQQTDKANVTGIGDDIKHSLEEEGKDLIKKLLTEGNTDEGFDAGFDLLGNVGFYMAACRRHDITEPTRETTSPLEEASALALQLGASLGVTPRFATAHLTTHNRAINGVAKSFTSLNDEFIFNDYNNRAVLAYKRAADALFRIIPLGISNPAVPDLLASASDALEDVTSYNATLFKALDVDAFFYQVRPYYKSYRVGQHIYRGANAGDFSGINVIDMLLGLCRADHAYYSQLLVDKMLYMMPEDQTRLMDCMRRKSLMDEMLETPVKLHASDWYPSVAKAFLKVCKMHGRTASQHHDQLVDKFISRPSQSMGEQHLDKLTASGPPLPVLLRSLEKLRDLRLAAKREDIPSRYADMEQIKASIGRS
jgi:hypothetical protein